MKIPHWIRETETCQWCWQPMLVEQIEPNKETENLEVTYMCLTDECRHRKVFKGERNRWTILYGGQRIEFYKQFLEDDNKETLNGSLSEGETNHEIK